MLFKIHLKIFFLCSLLVIGQYLSGNIKKVFARNKDPFRSSSDKDIYKLGPKDEIEIHVWGNRDFSGTVVIRCDGRINLPSVGEMYVQGMGTHELEKELASRLTYIESEKRRMREEVVAEEVEDDEEEVEDEETEDDEEASEAEEVEENKGKESLFENPFTNNPVVTISVIKKASTKILVFGKVRFSGYHFLKDTEEITLLHFFATRTIPGNINLKKSFVARNNKKLPVSLYRLFVEGSVKNNVTLLPGDVIYLAEKISTKKTLH